MKEKLLKANEYYIEYKTLGSLSKYEITQFQRNRNNFFPITDDLYYHFKKNQIEKIKNDIYKNNQIIHKEKIKKVVLDVFQKEQQFHEFRQSCLDRLSFLSENERKEFDKVISFLDKKEFYLLYPLIQTKNEKNQMIYQPIYLFKYSSPEKNNVNLVEIAFNSSLIEEILADRYHIDRTDVSVMFEIELEQFKQQLAHINMMLPIEKLVEELNAQIHLFLHLDTNFLDVFIKQNPRYLKIPECMLTFEEMSEKDPSKKMRDDLVTLYKIIKNSDYEEPKLLNSFLTDEPKNVKDLNNQRYLKPYMGSFPSDYKTDETQIRIVNAVSENDLISVIGPPGTGKSTLLRETIANKIVNTAIELDAIFDTPWEEKSVSRPKKEISYYKIPYIFAENIHSIVIASKNNEAISNVSDKFNRSHPYFEEVSRQYMETDSITKIQKNTGILGMICAKLGNNSNVEDFKTFLKELWIPMLLEKEYDKDEIIRKEFQNKVKRLNSYHQFIEEYYPLYSKFQDQIDFENIANENKNIKEKLEETHKELEKWLHEKNEKETIWKELQQEEESHLQMKKQIQDQKRELQRKELQLKQIKYENVLQKMWYQTLGKKKYEIKLQNKALELEILNLELEKLEEETQTNQNSYLKLQKNIACLNSELEDVNHRIDCINKIKESIIEKQNMIEMTEEATLEKKLFIKSHMSYYDFIQNHIISSLRMELFSISLKLQEQYILKHRKEILHNLNCFWDTEKQLFCTCFYQSDSIHLEKERTAIKDIWETIFLCFPVITTTLDSFTKKVFPLIPNYIDLLLIDESGQATSEYCMTPLYRSKKAIIVGDIYQIEPIYEDMSNKEYFLDKSKFEKHIAIHNRSIQHMANENTDIKENNQLIELKNHHRCEENIIRFSNQYVYQNHLVCHVENKPNKPFHANMLLFDIRSMKQPQANVNQDEIEAIIKIINSLKKQTKDEKIYQKIAIISPFRNQVEALKRRIHRDVSEDIKIGTTHTFQGKEMEYVIFSTVLDEYCKKSAIRFIGEKPNLLNVAVSRAINQFILVGNASMLKQSNNFSKKLYTTIQTVGKVYTIFDNENNWMEEENAKDILNILVANPDIKAQDPFGYYLNTFNSTIIESPKQHHEILLKALELSNKSVSICSPWISKNVVDDQFMEMIRKRIEEDINIQIKFGYQDLKQTDTSPEMIAKKEAFYHNEKDLKVIIEKLKKILKQNLIINQKTHAKILLIDDKYLIIGSHNWLSNAGKMVNPRSEISAISTSREQIEYIKKFITKNM